MIYLNLVYYFFPDHFSYKIYIGQIHFSLFIEKWHFIILFFSENAGKLFLKNIRLFVFRQILSKFHPFHPAGEGAMLVLIFRLLRTFDKNVTGILFD